MAAAPRAAPGAVMGAPDTQVRPGEAYGRGLAPRYDHRKHKQQLINQLLAEYADGKADHLISSEGGAYVRLCEEFKRRYSAECATETMRAYVHFAKAKRGGPFEISRTGAGLVVRHAAKGGKQPASNL